ncbi:unnamed protein product, partial [Acidithrix sp. C25]
VMADLRINHLCDLGHQIPGRYLQLLRAMTYSNLKNTI